MTHPDFRAELQALMDAAESFADPAIGHGIPWKTAMDRARAALAAPQQGVPVGERLPVKEDCDAEGRCWWWAPKHPECPNTGHDSWALYSGACIEDTHWLPHWALSAPQEAQP